MDINQSTSNNVKGSQTACHMTAEILIIPRRQQQAVYFHRISRHWAKILILTHVGQR